MWMVLPAISLALVHIAGDNAGVVPDAAATGAGNIYLVIVLSYMVFGSLMTGVSAWIGARSGYELGVLVRRMFGCNGKRIFATAVLGVSIPASALTGGFFAGWLLAILTGIPQPLAMLLCLALFSFLASGRGGELLAVSNYTSLLLLPLLLVMLFFTDVSGPVTLVGSGDIDWQMVLALIGYNAGGMRPALAAEAATCVSKKGGAKAVYLAVAAKFVEGILTLAMATIVLHSEAKAPLALAGAAYSLLGPIGGMLFGLILFTTFVNTMAPAMMVNARQTAVITGLGFWPSLGLATLAVFLVDQFEYQTILKIMAVGGLGMAGFIAYTAAYLHKYGVKQS